MINEVLETIGPRLLGDLARASNWTVPERMIAFDVDPGGRINAMISMEPMDRGAND